MTESPMPYPGFTIGSAEQSVLACMLAGQPHDRWYGYPLGRQARVRPGRLYPALARLAAAGWITDGWDVPGPRTRRYYQLTDLGRSQVPHYIR